MSIEKYHRNFKGNPFHLVGIAKDSDIIILPLSTNGQYGLIEQHIPLFKCC